MIGRAMGVEKPYQGWAGCQRSVCCLSAATSVPKRRSTFPTTVPKTIYRALCPSHHDPTPRRPPESGSGLQSGRARCFSSMPSSRSGRSGASGLATASRGHTNRTYTVPDGVAKSGTIHFILERKAQTISRTRHRALRRPLVRFACRCAFLTAGYARRRCAGTLMPGGSLSGGYRMRHQGRMSTGELSGCAQLHRCGSSEVSRPC